MSERRVPSRIDIAIQGLARDMAASIPVTVVSVAMFDESGLTLTVKAVSTARSLPQPVVVGACLRLSRAPRHRAVIESQAPILFDCDSEPQAFSSDEMRQALVPGLRSVYLVPIRFNGEVAGILVLGEMRSADREPFSESKRRRCDALVEEFAAASARAWEMDRLHQHVCVMSSLLRMVQGVIEARSYREVLGWLASDVSGWFGSPVRAVLLGRQPQGGMDIVARWNAPQDEVGTDGRRFLAALARSAEGYGSSISVVRVGDDPLDPLYDSTEMGETWSRICLAIMERDLLVGLACLYVEGDIRLSETEQDAFQRRAEILAVGMSRVAAFEEHRDEREWFGRAAWELLTTRQYAVLQETLAGVASVVTSQLPSRLERVLVDKQADGRVDPDVVRRIVEEVSTLLDELRGAQGSEGIAPIEINGLVGRAVEIVRVKWKELPVQSSGSVDVQFEPAAEPLLVESSLALVGPLVNALEHAVDAVPEGGRIHVRTARDSGYVVISVEESGPRVPAHVQVKPFAWSLSTAEAPRRQLCLSVFHAVAARHGGEARVSVGESGGTTLILRLPAAETMRSSRSSDV